MVADTKAGAGKVALITGANKGLGLETARQLCRAGAIVLLGARDLAKGERAAEELRSMGLDAKALKLDVVEPADIRAAVERIGDDHGRLDILINNAAVNFEDLGTNSTLSVSDDTLRSTFETNVFSLVSVTRALLPLLRNSDAGRIVNLSSIVGSLTLHSTPGSPIYDRKVFAYDASKAALNSFTIHLAHALRDTRIKVNSAHPGWVKTDMGTAAAPMEIVDGAKTSVRLALLGDDGPTGGFFHMAETLPW